MAEDALSPEAGLSITDPFLALDLSTPKPGEFSKGLGRGARRLGEAGARTASAVTGGLGLDTIAGYFDQKADEFDKSANAPERAPRVPDVESIKGIGDTADYITSLVGEQVPQFGAQVVGSLVGGSAARAFGASRGAATVLGAAAPSFVQNFGDNLSEQKQAGVNEPGIAAGAAGLQAALDSVLFSSVAQRLGGSMSHAASTKARAGLAASILKGAGVEGITEGLQEGIGIAARVAVDPNYANKRDEQMSRILNAVVGGGILGAGFGSASHLITGGTPGQPVPQEAPTPAASVGPVPAPVTAPPALLGPIAPQVSPITGEDLNAPFPGIEPDTLQRPILSPVAPRVTSDVNVTLPDVYIPPAPLEPVAPPPAPSRHVRSASEIGADVLERGATQAQMFNAATGVEQKRVRSEPVLIGQEPAQLDVTRAMDELRTLEINHKRQAGELLTSDEIRHLRYAERGMKVPEIAVEKANEPRLRGGPEAERTAQSFVTERIDEAASSVLTRLVAQKGISQGNANVIRRMIRNRMPEVYAQDGDNRGQQFNSVLRDIVSKTPLRADADQFLADVNAEIGKDPTKNQMPSGAREFVAGSKPIKGAETTPVIAGPATVTSMAPEKRRQVIRMLPPPTGFTEELFGGRGRASASVTRQIASKQGRPMEDVAKEQLTLFSKAALTLDPKQVAENHNARGGSTTDPVSGTELAGSRGFAVSGLPGRELIIGGALTPEQVTEYMHANADALSQPGAVLGTWKNADTGNSHIDVSVVSQTLEEAMQIARDSNQLAVWDMRLGVEIPVGHAVFNAAQVYNSQSGLPPRMPVAYAEVDVETMTQLADSYAAAVHTPDDPEVQAAYAAMNQELKAQYDLLAQQIKIETWQGTGQPYENSAAMRADVFGNNHLWVWAGGEPHSLMSQEENLRYRAVHDLFGHATTGFEFGPRGELNAFRAHAQTLSDLALRAFASESIAQVAYVNFHPSNLNRPMVDRLFPKQQAALMPETVWRKVLNAPLDAQAKVYYDFQKGLVEKGQAAVDFLNKVIGGNEDLTLQLNMSGTQYAGKYTKRGLKSVIELSLNAKDVLSTGAHEGWHYLEENVLNDAERSAVDAELTPGKPKYERLLAAARVYDNENKTNITAEILEDQREARAYGYEFWRHGALEADGMLRRVFEKIQDVLRRVSGYFRGKPFASMTDIFEAIERGDYATKRKLKVVQSNQPSDTWYEAVEKDILPGAELTFYKEKPASEATGRPWWVTTGNHVTKMRNDLRKLALEGAAGRTWHRRSAEAALVFAKGDRAAATRVAALFANYSPRSRVGFDARSAFIAILKHSQGLPIKDTGAAFPTRMDAQAQDILDGKYDVTGIKRESFFWNMMKYIDPDNYPEAGQRATIDMWMALALGHDHVAVRDPEYLYGDAEVKRLARELGWGVDETQAAVWIAIKGRMDPQQMRDRVRAIAEKRGWTETATKDRGEGNGIKKEYQREYYKLYRDMAMAEPLTSSLQAEIAKANYAYDNALRDLATGKINLAGTKGRIGSPMHLEQNLKDIEAAITPVPGTDFRGLKSKNTGTADLFSRAAMIDLEDKLRRGEFDKIGTMRAMEELTAIAQPAESKVAKMIGIGADAKYKAGDVLGFFSRAIQRWISSGEYRATKSGGYANVHNVLTYFDQRKKRLISTAVDQKLNLWRAASSADLSAVSKALLERTMRGHEVDSDGYVQIIRSLTEDQRRLFKQATDMISSELDAEFEADQKVYSRLLGADSKEYTEWQESRGAHVAELKKSGYFPERRYGDHAVNVFVTLPNGKRVTVAFETYETASQAKLRINGTKGAPGLKDTLAPFTTIGVDYAFKYKPELDGSVSFQRVMELLDANGVEITQSERERIAKALIAADSTKRNRIFRRENVPGASVDGLRVLSEFAVANASKIAYSEFGDAINRARAGNMVRAEFDQAGNPIVAYDKTTDLWALDDHETSGFYRNLADQKVGYVLQPDNNKIASGARALASMQFLGGSIAAAGVQLTSLPMNSVPWLTQHTSYWDAHAKVFGGLKTVVANGGVFFQAEASKVLSDLQALDKPMDGIDNVPGLRQALIVAFQDGTTLDTDIYEIMGLARGQILSLPRAAQKAADAWMYPFRKAEQTNRWSTFIAAYKIAQSRGLTGRRLYEFAKGAVDSTQFRYDTVNRPTLANTPIGALVMTFKSYPVYMAEMILGMAKHDRKAAIIMLGTLWFFAGLEGMPFFEDAEDLVDTIAQRLFGSPFNSQRFLRNMIADASEVVPFIPNSDILMKGTVNFLSDANVAGRVGLGNMLPGTRMFTAGADYKRTAEEIVGPGLSAATGWAKFVGTWGKGDLELALRNAPFTAVQNLAKGYSSFSRGYYTDGRGQKLVDAGPIGTFLQGVGFTPESVRQAQETAGIDREQNAFYTEFKAGLTSQMISGLRDGDQGRVTEVVELTRQWNIAHPDMPILINGSSVRRAVALSGMTLSQRTLALLPKQLRYNSATYESR